MGRNCREQQSNMDCVVEWYETYQITQQLTPCTDFEVENLIY
jgi:hypothetical protein